VRWSTPLARSAASTLLGSAAAAAYVLRELDESRSEKMYYAICDGTGLVGWMWRRLAGTHIQLQTVYGESVEYDHHDMAYMLDGIVRQMQLRLHPEPIRWGRSLLEPGQYHARIQRQERRQPNKQRPHAYLYPESLPMDELYASQCQSSLAAARGLFTQLDQVFRCIEPDTRNLAVFGHELRHLLMLACAEIESGLKAVLKANGVIKNRYEMKDYRRLKAPMLLANWKVELRSYPKFPKMAPFSEWPDAGPPAWWKAHNATKHDRELELASATLKSTVDAVAALYVVIAAQFGAEVLEDLGHQSPMRLAADGLPQWEPSKYYVPPALGGKECSWSAVPLRSEGAPQAPS
jgi:hypothetical protein